MASPRILGGLAAAYLLAGGVGVVVAHAVDVDRTAFPLAVALVAAIVVFLFSHAFDNSSLFDPYWSLVPPAVAVYWWFVFPASTRGLVVLYLVWIWASSLTFNWLRRWRGLADEDWRYAMLRKRWSSRYWQVSFFGIHLLPALLVLAGCVPMGFALSSERDLGWLDAVAVVLVAGGIVLEAVADGQLRRFRADPRNRGARLTTGVWRRLRYPNYVGEVAFWWGLGLFGLAAEGPLWAIIGPAVITLLFLLVSVPMMERRLATRSTATAGR